MTSTNFVPSLPAGLERLLQPNWLSRFVREELQADGSYQLDARPDPMPAGIGRTMDFVRLGEITPTLEPALATGAVERGTFSSSAFSASPLPYAEGVDISLVEARQQTAGNLWAQKLSRLCRWAGKTKARLARARVFGAVAGGQTVIRRAQTTSDSVLLVDSLAGFRYVQSNGAPVAVSATTPLGITIKAATTFTALVTGTTPIDSKFPDGPGQLTLSTALSANVAASSYCYRTDSKPFIVRPGNRASTESLLSTDIPTLADILAMRAKMIDDGVAPNPLTGTYHLHVDPWFFTYITTDTAFRQAFQSAGVSPIFNARAVWSQLFQITVIESNDAPAVGKSGRTDVAVGDAAFTYGATGTPGSSKTMRIEGLPVINSSGVYIRRALMTGEDFLSDVYVDESEYAQLAGLPTIHRYADNIAMYQTSRGGVIEANLERWRFIFRPPIDDRGLIWSVVASATFDLVLPTDVESGANTADARPYKRGIVLEHGALS